MWPLWGLITTVALSGVFLIAMFVLKETAYANDISLLLFVFLTGASIAAASQMGYNLWPGLLIAASMMCGAITFMWGINRFAYRGLVMRTFAGFLMWLTSWPGAAIVVARKYMGWGVPVELIGELPWGLPNLTDPRVAELQRAAEGPVGEDQVAVNPSQMLERAAVAANPDPEVRRMALQEK